MVLVVVTMKLWCVVHLRILELKPLAPGTEGGFTTYWPTDEIMPIYDAAMKYKEDGTGLAVLAGNDYGMDLHVTGLLKVLIY